MENVTPVGPESTDFFVLMLEKVLSGEWLVFAAMAVIALVYAVRRFVAPRIPFLATDHGGAILALAGGVLGGIANAVWTDNAISLEVVYAGAVVGFTAAGGYATLKKIGRWLLGLVTGGE